MNLKSKNIHQIRNLARRIPLHVASLVHRAEGACLTKRAHYHQQIGKLAKLWNALVDECRRRHINEAPLRTCTTFGLTPA